MLLWAVGEFNYMMVVAVWRSVTSNVVGVDKKRGRGCLRYLLGQFNDVIIC